MIQRETTWGAVTVGSYVKDTRDVTWRVDAERDGRVLLVRPGADPVAMGRPPADKPVTVLEPTDAEALAVVEKTLGAEVLVVKQEGLAYATCPPLQRRLDVVHTHFLMMHAVWTKSGPGSKSLEKLLEEHRNDHLSDTPASHGFVAHVHKEIRQ